MGEPRLEIERQIKYWQRCLKSVLPTQYTSTDSTRMALGFFILSALDLLGVGADTFPEEDRKNIREWILKCQHPNGGFCGSPNHRFPDVYYLDIGQGKQQMDPANLPATFFAILSLSFTGSLDLIKRDECLRWLKRLQRDDGSFGELITENGTIEGGSDMRYCYIAVAVRWMLRGDTPLNESVKIDDIDLDKMIGHIRAGQTYDGGISESFQHEPHAGYTYCAIAALSILNRLTDSTSDNGPGLTNISQTIHWLVSRQLGYTEEDGEEEEIETSAPPVLAGVYQNGPSKTRASGMFPQDEKFVGLNGRCNKRADTCYAYWVTASLAMFREDKVQLLNTQAIRRFLFEQTQHRIGGFGKIPGDPPDIYHSYLGLAALAVLQEPGLKSLDSALCVSIKQKEIIGQLREVALFV